GNHRELRAKILEELQVLRRLIIAAGPRGSEIGAQEAESQIDGDEAASDFLLCAPRRLNQSGQKRQSDADTRRTKKMTPIDRAGIVQHEAFLARVGQMPRSPPLLESANENHNSSAALAGQF